ncbi:hypothetical protein C7212DRAFT_275052 [Tuber magnatum]|uniref:SWIM-type domain-containing protein n=1 Tax=Tuber magnatum TaxID=42249 RepID=A0A317SWQ0_9PEZI|nr:hypothetical protein C7212DRAFT_275052 [Tuber magnatum]
MNRYPYKKRNWDAVTDDIRYERALTQNIKIQSYTTSPRAPEISCEVRGSTGAKYTVYLSTQNVPDCSCPDCGNGNVCKHIYNVVDELLGGRGVGDAVYEEWDMPLIALAKSALGKKFGRSSNGVQKTATPVPAPVPAPAPAAPVFPVTAPARLPAPAAQYPGPGPAALLNPIQQASPYPNIEAEVDDLLPHTNIHTFLRTLAITNPSVLAALRTEAMPRVHTLDFTNLKNQVLHIAHTIDNVPESARSVVVRGIEDHLWGFLNEIKTKTTKHTPFRARSTGFEVCLMVLKGLGEVGGVFLRQNGLVKSALEVMIHLDMKGDMVRKFDREVMWWVGVYANIEGGLFGRLIRERGEIVVLE